MEKTKTGFWRNFTWRKLFHYSLLYFFISLVIAIITNYFDKGETIEKAFTLSALILRIITAVLFGIILAIWIEPSDFKSKKNDASVK